VAGGWRRLQSEEFQNLYASSEYYNSDQVKEDEMGKACSMHGSYGAYKI
jgi:hypothetical protein